MFNLILKEARFSFREIQLVPLGPVDLIEPLHFLTSDFS